MKSYRLVIRQQGRIVGHFDTTGEAGAGGCLRGAVAVRPGRRISVRTAGL